MNSIDFINYKGTQYSIGGVNGKTHLKILVLGNSYATDAWSYVPFILMNYGITCEIVIYFRGALSLDELVTFWESTDSKDESTTDNVGSYRYLYTIDTRTQTNWQGVSTVLERKSAKELCMEKGWDIITLLQWSAYTIDYTRFEPMTQVIDLIRGAKEEAENDESWKLGFQMSWTRCTHDEPLSNLASHLSNDKAQPIDILFPCATAVFNARQNETLAAIGKYNGSKGGLTHNLWNDGVHLEDGIPCYIASLAIVQSLFDKYWRGLSVLGNNIRPTRDNVKNVWKVPQAQSPSPTSQYDPDSFITEDNCYLAQKAAILANKYKFEINGV